MVIMPNGPASVLVYKVTYIRDDEVASISWWNGKDWSAAGELYEKDDLYKFFEVVGSNRILYSSSLNKIEEIWAIGR